MLLPDFLNCLTTRGSVKSTITSHEIPDRREEASASMAVMSRRLSSLLCFATVSHTRVVLHRSEPAHHAISMRYEEFDRSFVYARMYRRIERVLESKSSVAGFAPVPVKDSRVFGACTGAADSCAHVEA
jgi:hypothetical protein